MKVLFVLTCNGGGRGGHNHSLDHISRAIAQKTDVKIISVGLTESPVIKENPYYFGYFKFKWFSYFTLNKNFKELFKTFNPDIIHCFDSGSALLLMAQPTLFNKKIIYTKCGGPNERKSIAQVASDVFLFSQENFDSYKNNIRFKNSDLHLMPNRVFKIDLWEEKEREILKDVNIFNFVRIARIGESYKKSMEQAIDLISKVVISDKKIKLYIIGVIEDKNVYKDLSKYADLKKVEVQFITNHLTDKASKMLYLADAVIGTGRGAMEAMSLGIPTLVPVRGEEFPELLTPKNFYGFLSTNFSPRGVSTTYDEVEIISNVNNLVHKSENYKEATVFAIDIAKKEFLVNEEIVEKYISIYKNTILKRNHIYILKNVLPFFYYLNSFRKSQKLI